MPTKITTEKFIERAKAVHGDKYDYSRVDYITYNDNVKIICKEHGEFEQSYNAHVYQQQKCPKCGGRINNINDLINKFRTIHGNTYDYSLITEYKSPKVKIPIICYQHGVFYQNSDNHVQGKGCPKCIGRNKTTEDIINEMKLKHGNIYDYSEVKYKTMKTKVKILCREHGVFLQSPDNHISKGHGCPKCIFSTGEQIISEYLGKRHIDYISQKKFKDCKNLKTGKHLKFDFYIKTYNICIEYDGIQHFKPRYFGKWENKSYAKYNT